MEALIISKREALAAYEGSVAKLASALGITRSSIYQWPDGPINEKQALRLRFILRPDIFGPPPSNKEEDM